MNPTLSTYFPPGTAYFYGYPAGEDSGFYNEVPGNIEQLVSARPLVCAGPGMRIVTFAQSSRDDLLDLLEETGVQVIDRSQIIRLPEDITEFQGPLVRNEKTVDALAKAVPDGTLVMAQPFEREQLENKYQLPQDLCRELNDKLAMPTWVPSDLLPRTLCECADGAEFAASSFDMVPCVVKVSASSSGDGVRVCDTPDQLAAAKAAFADVCERVFVQEKIEAWDNMGMQFGIPADLSRPIDIIGLSRQVVSPDGEFLGGVVDPFLGMDPALAARLQNEVLPRLRERGWFGVGGIDILRTREGRYYLIDPNLRMTAMTAPVYASQQSDARRKMLSLTARFRGSEKDFIRLTQCGTADQLFRLTAIRRDGDSLQFNGMLLFDYQENLRENSRRALREGFDSQMLRTQAEEKKWFFPAEWL